MWGIFMNGKKGVIIHMGCSALIGVLFFLIGQILYPSLTENIWTPLGIALYFLVFSVIMLISMFVLNQIRQDYSYWYKTGKKDTIKKAYIRGIVCILVLFILSGACEFLYELGKEADYDPTSYVFLIDDSGSMSANDPQCVRSEAIGKIMENQADDLPYAVYKFTDQSQLIKVMGKYSKSDKYEFLSDGGTDIVTSLDTVINELLSKKVNGGDHPKVLLLSDGESSNWGIKDVISKCRDNEIAVSTIGFNVNSHLLSKIARKTGGIYINVNDIDDLQEQMNKAITSFLDRNLISDRFVLRNDGLYAFLRILFLCLMGVVFSWMKYESFCSAKGPKYDGVVLKVSLAGTAIASIMMEICFSVFDLPSWLIRLIFCILWAVTPGYFIKSGVYSFDPDYKSDDDNGYDQNNNQDKDTLAKKREEAAKKHTLSDASSSFGFSTEDNQNSGNNISESENGIGFGFGFGDDFTTDSDDSTSWGENNESGFGQDDSGF